MRLAATLMAFALAVQPGEAAAMVHGDHPLVDTIVEVATGRSLTPAELIDALAAADFVLLGEKHDNVRHHSVQAELVAALGQRGRLRAVAFEMLPTDRQAAVVEHLADGGRVADLDRAVGWAELGWGPWSWYGPIAHAATRHGATLVAANLTDDEIGRIYRDGLDGLPAVLRSRTGLDVPLDGADRAAREAAMVEAHCGHDLGAAAARMVDVQRARDARMAERLATLAGRGQGALVTGNAHAAKDVGVPVVLARLQPTATVASLGLIEIEPDWTAPPANAWPYDYVWFTPRALPVDHDYCAAFRRGG